MENRYVKKENDSQCPNCAELWKRIDKLTEEKAKGKMMQGMQLVTSIVLLILICIAFAVQLVSR